MLLDSIRSPRDLRNLDTGQLTQLADEIRTRVVEAVDRTGGHLGSNLGVVELTMALHRVFNSPDDIILWDVGHQAYVHKMLTGRLDDFSDLRQPGGLSGYPSRSESPHDWIENSHASTVLAYAHGLATAHSATGEGRRIVAVIGDGALTGGMAFEGLNNLGNSELPVTVVLNDNGRSYAPTVGRLSESLIHIRANPTYMRRQRRLEELAEQLPWVGELLERGISATKAAIREMFEPTAFFEALGVHYLGPFDGHDIAEIEEALTNASEFDGPVVVHVLTQKGRGFEPAEQDPIKHMHDTSGVKPGSYTEAFTESLIKAAESRPDVVAITAAMPDSTGLLPFHDRFPGRCFDVGIAEQHAVTAAAGMALGGLRPVVAIYSTFLTRAIDQVNLDVSLYGLPVLFCLDRAGVTGDDGPSHHGLLDMVLLSKVPGMTILAPSSYQELQQMLDDALAITDGPVTIRWPKTSAPQVAWDQVGTGLSARQVSNDPEARVCLIGAGKMLAVAEEAAALLKRRGIASTVWDPRAVRPLDPEMLSDAAGHQLVVTIEDGFREGGFGSAVRDAVSDISPDTRVSVLGVPVAHHAHGRPEDLLASFGLDAAGVVASVLERLP
ncbi:MAG TPA: 1-deoxy-D-xylulose-5-phosphate synthase [Acidimicrobiales bacterium]|nr:1-deoxy-D-xylulose-5-phosphate synthase [Actinomycetota bacterium]MDP6062695.1 1-deoxy-D-xylulose-5-phosphate synthase [Acidimicrobiales bacterium]MDP7209147.1 1-deoxy-D-xylulose-5-phosphate synthase [Acidimicrobiales bacterium]HJL88773.1 1-deoxy-D-xylulose-5-phosphate synthase [Acidimicrobiales bacterium]HJO98941.1 1-deoxy-D-xylulose-5-phosphate synthase [Acidimicrobiales bacterium]